MTNQPTSPADQAEPVPPRMRFPESEDFPTGPEVGERLPEIILPNQHGELVNLEEARGERRALVLFHRSVRW